MLSSAYLNQTAKLTKSRTLRSEPVLDAYGEPLPASSITIACRKERRTRDVQTANGTILKSSTYYYLDTLVAPTDLLDEHPIIDISDWVDFNGNVQGYQVIV